jgi:hypothetical protein
MPGQPSISADVGHYSYVNAISHSDFNEMQALPIEASEQLVPESSLVAINTKVVEQMAGRRSRWSGLNCSLRHILQANGVRNHSVILCRPSIG